MPHNYTGAFWAFSFCPYVVRQLHYCRPQLPHFSVLVPALSSLVKRDLSPTVIYTSQSLATSTSR